MTTHSLRQCVIAAAATISLACAGERTFGAERQEVLSRHRTSAPHSRRDDRKVRLGECANLNAPAGSKLLAHYYASGVQIYRWSGMNWTFVAPEAVLFADAGGNRKVGTHYAGPTWESVSGSKVVGTVSQRCTADTTAIPWLSLDVASSEGPGIFQRVTFIQRLNTVGGVAPSAPGSAAGEAVKVPYTAEYFFYR